MAKVYWISIITSKKVEHSARAFAAVSKCPIKENTE